MEQKRKKETSLACTAVVWAENRMGTLEVKSGQIRDVISRKRCWDWTWLVRGTEEAKDGTWCWA